MGRSACISLVVASFGSLPIRRVATLPRRWWTRRPFLPIPPGDYIRFRLQTQYGSAKHRIEAVDVLNYLSWCKLHRALAS